jgi:hypothetical protein
MDVYILKQRHKHHTMDAAWTLFWIFFITVPLTLSCFGFWYYFHPTRTTKRNDYVYNQDAYVYQPQYAYYGHSPNVEPLVFY